MNNKIKYQRAKIKKMNRCLFAIWFLIFGLSVLPACSKHSSTSAIPEAGKTLYHCAMHPQIVSDKPGECPICHMRLIPVENGRTKNPGKKNPEHQNGLGTQAYM